MLRTHFIFARAGIWLAHALLACMLLTLHWHALAAQPLKLAADMPPKMLVDGLEYLEDPAQTLSFEQVRALPSDRFTALSPNNTNVGFTASAFWLSATLANPGRQAIEWTVHHRAPFTDFVEYWVVVDGKVITTAIGGDRTTVSERQVPYRFPAVRHISAPGETAQLFIRVRNSQRAYVPLWFELNSGSQFIRMMAFNQLCLGVLYAMPLVLAMMALAGWGIARNRRFVLYAFYAVSVLGFWLGVNGQLGEYLFIDMPAVSNNALPIFLLLAIMFSSIFSRDFLRTRELIPWGGRYFLMLILLSVIGIVLQLAGGYSQVSLLAIAMLALNTSTPAIGWLALRRGMLYARWYVLAQLTYSTTLALGMLMWWLSSCSYGGLMLMQYAFFGQLLLLPVAQYDRMRILQRDKERMERDYRETLEAQVAQRTRDLEEARAKADRADHSKSEFFLRIEAERMEGEGATLFFDVELGSTSEEDTQVPAIPPVQPPQACPGKPLAGVRILQIDDDPINQLLARELLEQEGADASAGDAAVEHAPERDAAAMPGQPVARLEQLLERFTETLATVNAGLAPLMTEQTPLAGEDDGANDPDLLLRLEPLLQELKVCLQHNDTRAEQWVTEMEKLAVEQPPLWLTRLAAAVRALEYDAALELLPRE